jgi:hypothetical protein
MPMDLPQEYVDGKAGKTAQRVVTPKWFAAVCYGFVALVIVAGGIVILSGAIALARYLLK